MAGIKGAKIILAVKFKKKIAVKKRRDPNCKRKEGMF